MKVCAGTITSSPGPIPAASSASVSAAVPERDADAVLDAAVGGELGLEGVDLGAEDEAAVAEDRVEGGAQFGASGAWWRSRSTNGTDASAGRVSVALIPAAGPPSSARMWIAPPPFRGTTTSVGEVLLCAGTSRAN